MSATTTSPYAALILNTSAMFFGSMLAGLISLPGASRKQLALVNCFGCGLLLGTALNVVLPEGVTALYEDEARTEHTERWLGVFFFLIPAGMVVFLPPPVSTN